MPTIEQSLEKGKNLQEFISSTVYGGRASFINEQKNIILLAYFDLAMEHHHSIFLLIIQKNFGSAFALLRPLVEIVFRAHWVTGCASQIQIDRIHKDENFRFPRPKQISACLDTVFKADVFFSTWKKSAWGPLNDFVHSGLLALGRRFSGHNVQPNYSESEIAEAVRFSNASLILLGKMFFTHFNRTDDAKAIESFLEPDPLEPQ